MLAQVQRRFGGPDAFAFEDVPEPVPAPGELLIEVHACGLNRLDLLQREAPLVRGFALPHIAGLDVSGIVRAHGADVPAGAPSVGTRVLVDAVSTCGVCDRCTTGLAPYCEDVRTTGSTRPGGFAELVCVPATNAYPIPDDWSFVRGAAIPVTYITAWHALVVAGRVQAGETVLVNAAGAGVSVALIQLAKAHGATVIGTIGGPERIPKALAIGCDHVIDHRAVSIGVAVRDLTGGRGVDLAVDHVGPALFQQTIDSLAIGGRMVFCGTTTGTHVEVNLPGVYHWGRVLIGAGGYQHHEFGDMLAAIRRHDIEPVIDSVLPFRELPAAQARMEAGGFFGRIIVSMDD